MRYGKDQKDITRQRIVETAAAQFRRNGTEGVGLVGLMKRAGLTHGGFYSHFKSKEELIQESVDLAFAQRSLAIGQGEEGALAKAIRRYLSPEHRDHPETGCPIACLVGEMPHRTRVTRAKFSTKADELVVLFEDLLPKDWVGSLRRKTARAITSLLVGTLQMARTSTHPGDSAQVLEAGIEAALNLADRRP